MLLLAPTVLLHQKKNAMYIYFVFIQEMKGKKRARYCCCRHRGVRVYWCDSAAVWKRECLHACLCVCIQFWPLASAPRERYKNIYCIHELSWTRTCIKCISHFTKKKKERATYKRRVRVYLRRKQDAFGSFNNARLYESLLMYEYGRIHHSRLYAPRLCECVYNKCCFFSGGPANGWIKLCTRNEILWGIKDHGTHCRRS